MQTLYLRAGMRQVIIMMNVNEFEKKQILFVFLNRGEKVSFANDNIIVKDAEGKIKHQSTCYRLFMVFIVGSLSITSGIVQRAHKFGFPIVLMTTSMRVYDYMGGKMEGNVLLRKHQYNYEKLDLAKHILINKLQNQRWLLNLQRDKSENVKEAIQQIDQYLQGLIEYEGDLQGLLGFEGSAARVYFKNHFNNIPWNGRKPRIKPDFINSTLDIGYTILFNVMDALLNVYGFDVYCGLLHRQFYMRKSLVCDFVEPFRPLIDRQVKKAINLGQCREEDFALINHKYMLKWANNAKYIQFMMQPFLDNKKAMFLYVQGFYRAFMKQKEAKDYPIYLMEWEHDYY